MWKPNQGVLPNYLQFTHLDHQCLLIRRSFLDKAGHYDERLPRSQDCDLIVRLCLLDGKWEHVRKKLFTFEKHEADQDKQFGSIYGKTLWTLKNNIVPSWLFGLLRTPELMFAFNAAINEFMTDDKWLEDKNKSEAGRQYDGFAEKLKKDITE